jgi:endogenous inhibitor of DNA gyrase (YacG/DUF329 family)
MMAEDSLNQNLVACPTCRKNTFWSPTNKARPFCSERCKLIDFGEWAKENYIIPETEKSESSETEQ